MLRSRYLILLNLGPITVEPTVLCDGKDFAGEGLILPRFEPGLAWAAAGLGWWPRSRHVMAPGLWSLCRDSVEAEAGVCSYCVGQQHLYIVQAWVSAFLRPIIWHLTHHPGALGWPKGCTPFSGRVPPL